MRKVMLTTYDNPHSPFDDFLAWYTFDVSSGYNTSIFLARLMLDSDELSESDQDRLMEATIDDIIKENVNGVFKKVVVETEDD